MESKYRTVLVLYAKHRQQQSSVSSQSVGPLVNRSPKVPRIPPLIYLCIFDTFPRLINMVNITSGINILTTRNTNEKKTSPRFSAASVSARKTGWKHSPEPFGAGTGAVWSSNVQFRSIFESCFGFGGPGPSYFGHGGLTFNGSLIGNTDHTLSHGHQRSARPLKGELGGSERSMLSRNHLGPLLPGPYAGMHSASDFRGDFVSHCWRLAAAHEGRVMAFRGAFAVTSLPVTLQPAFPIHDMLDSDFPDKETSWRFVKHEREGAR